MSGKYCVKKNPDGTYRLAKKGDKPMPKAMDAADALEKKIQETKKGK